MAEEKAAMPLGAGRFALIAGEGEARWTGRSYGALDKPSGPKSHI